MAKLTQEAAYARDGPTRLAGEPQIVGRHDTASGVGNGGEGGSDDRCAAIAIGTHGAVAVLARRMEGHPLRWDHDLMAVIVDVVRCQHATLLMIAEIREAARLGISCARPSGRRPPS